MGKIVLFLSVISIFKCSSGRVVWSDASQLQPVQGLYIKPSADGTTGDLFVAATEDTGTKSQWLTDQPINFLPAATQLQPAAALPVTLAATLPSPSSAQEESESTQKQAAVAPATPPVNYAYALPVPASDGKVLTPCPYALAANADGVKWPEGTTASQYSTAFQYFYPQMMAAMSRAVNTFAGSEAKDKGASAALSVPPYWPQAYTYPYQYLMIDPTAWTQSQKEATTVLANQAESNSDESSS